MRRGRDRICTTWRCLFTLILWLWVHEGVARSVSVFFSMMMLLFLYLLIRRLDAERGKALALYAVIFAAFSPLGMALSRLVQPDITMLGATMGALYMCYRYAETQKIKYYVCSVIFMTFAVLTRIYALYLFIPLLYVVWMHQGVKLFKDPKNYLYIAIVSLALLWYVYMWYLGQTLDLYYPVYQFERGEMQVHHNYFRLFSWSNMKLPLKIFFVHILTPLGALCLFAGMISKKLDKKHALMVVWLLSVVFYLLVMWPIAVSHSYYLLPLIPVLSYFVALGADWFLQRPRILRFCRSPFVFIPVIVVQLFWISYFYRLLYFIPPERQAIVKTGQIADAMIPKDDLVIASWGGSPIQLYYCHRRGWALNLTDPDTRELMTQLEAKRRQGAAWFVTSKTGEIKRNREFEEHLRDRYKVIHDDRDTLLVDLRTSLP